MIAHPGRFGFTDERSCREVRTRDRGAQAGRVAVERTALITLLVGESGDATAVQDLFRRLTAAHTARMAAVGLNN